MDLLDALLDGWLPGLEGGRRRRRSLTRWLGVPLVIVTWALGLAGAVICGRELGGDLDASQAALALSIPFGGTSIAGLVGARGVARSLTAALIAAAVAAFGGMLVALVLVFDALFLPW